VPVQRTLVLLKPDAVQRGLVGTILGRFEHKGLKLIALKLRQFAPATIEKHYEPHKGKPFYPGLVKYMSSSPVVAMALEGVDAIEVVRGMMGATNSRKAAPGTIRGDLGMSFSNNLVHGSDSAESAQRELGIFFSDASEVVEWNPVATPWIYNVAEELA
jgi:nucleoside-diphosphate kinase